MATLHFDRGSLQLTGFGEQWRAVSGGGSFAALEAGSYACPAGSLMVGTETAPGAHYNDKYADDPYVDDFGLGWFLWLGVGDLGIHPDGNVPGTRGCIGVQTRNTRPLFDLLRNVSSSEIVVQVD